MTPLTGERMRVCASWASACFIAALPCSTPASTTATDAWVTSKVHFATSNSAADTALALLCSWTRCHSALASLSLACAWANSASARRQATRACSTWVTYIASSICARSVPSSTAEPKSIDLPLERGSAPRAAILPATWAPISTTSSGSTVPVARTVVTSVPRVTRAVRSAAGFSPTPCGSSAQRLTQARLRLPAAVIAISKPQRLFPRVRIVVSPSRRCGSSPGQWAMNAATRLVEGPEGLRPLSSCGGETASSGPFQR